MLIDMVWMLVLCVFFFLRRRRDTECSRVLWGWKRGKGAGWIHNEAEERKRLAEGVKEKVRQDENERMRTLLNQAGVRSQYYGCIISVPYTLLTLPPIRKL